METKVQKWGNSLAVRIPKPFAAELGLKEDEQVEIRVSEGAIVVTPTPHIAYRLEDLLAGVRPRNLHGEVTTGARRGKEIW